MNRYWFENYGCQMNLAEANALKLELANSGWTEASGKESADMVILNSCSVRKTAEQRVEGRIGYYKSLKKNRPFLLALMGCFAEKERERLKERYPEIDILVTTNGKSRFISELKNLSSESPFLFFDDEEYQFLTSHKSSSSHLLLPIMHGCNNFCSYCIVPYVRGREQSRRPGEIVDEINAHAERGGKVVTLLGQSVNSYNYRGSEGSVDFSNLLSLIEKECCAERIKFLSPHPKDMGEKVVAAMASIEAVAPHIHLPVQHGSTEILKAMNRQYSREEYLKIISLLKTALPNISISTDIMVGFPGEGEHEFYELLSLMEQVQFSEAFTYYYNEREGTKAAKREDSLPLPLKKERLAKVIALQERISSELRSQRVGGEATFLAESESKKSGSQILGESEYGESIVVDREGVEIGQFYKVELKELSGRTFIGKVIS